ncbi:uncharacterized protein LOC126549691 [Aphis gossypii]|uniref:uncharacterized protein LOC126549691 n=1 Tax=Aphis gossypii TaxID=80765 RepID=UPI0021598A2B|nr:uncharacterized protein LOC126549691 [Aphis gossypii]
MWFNNMISNNWKMSIAIGGIAVGFAGLAAAYNKLYNNENRQVKYEIIPIYKKKLEELGMVDNNSTIGPIFLCGKKNNDDFDLPDEIIIENYLNSFSEDPYDDTYSRALMETEIQTGLAKSFTCLRQKKYELVEEACKEELAKKKNKNKKKRLMRKIRRTLALNLLGTFAILRGDYVTAIEHLTTVVETSSASKKLVINSLIKRSSILYQRRQFKESLDDLQLAENYIHEIKRSDEIFNTI